MPPVRISSLNWNFTPFAKITRRATIEEIEEVFQNKPQIVAANRRDTRSTHLAICQTDAGRRLVVPFIIWKKRTRPPQSLVGSAGRGSQPFQSQKGGSSCD